MASCGGVFEVYCKRAKCASHSFCRILRKWLSAAEELPGDDDPLDFARSLADFSELRVSQHPLHGIVGNVSVAAMDLDRFVRHERGHLARVQFRHSGLFLERKPSVLKPRSPP